MSTTQIPARTAVAALLSLVASLVPLGSASATDGTGAPAFDLITDGAVDEGATLSVRLVATDPDGDEVTVSIEPALPSFVAARSIRSGRLLLTLSPNFGDAGVYGPFDVIATDGAHETTAQWSFTVTAPDTDAEPDPTDDPNSACDATPGALQAVIDGHPDGVGIVDPKTKLTDAEMEGYVILDFDDACFADQGEVRIDARSGIWLRRFEAEGTTLVVEASSFITLSGFSLAGLVVNDSDNVRIEAASTGSLMVAGGTDFMMGKMDITGPTVFDSMSRLVDGRSFARSSDFTTVEITGVVVGFSLEASTFDVEPTISCEPCTNLGLKSLTYP